MPKNLKEFSEDVITGNELNESYAKFYIEFGRVYRSGKKYSAKQWIGVMRDLLDYLD
jgi:hypothetical protein